MPITWTVPGHFWNQDWYGTLEAKLHEGSDELGQLVLYKVGTRTPVDTGALLADQYYVAHPSPGDPVLAEILEDTANQQAEWGRIYMLYQEGGQLGLATYTNAPHEMFARVLTDDVPDIENWGLMWIAPGLNALAAGAGIP